MKKKTYSRQYLRNHYVTSVYVSNDGEHAERDYFDKETNTRKVLSLFNRQGNFCKQP